MSEPREHTRRPGERSYWLDQPRNVDRVAYALYAVCAVIVVADALYVKHPYFDFEYLFGFHAWYGFVACVALVLIAKQMRRVVKRDETYYESDVDKPERGDRAG